MANKAFRERLAVVLRHLLIALAALKYVDSLSDTTPQGAVSFSDVSPNAITTFPPTTHDAEEADPSTPLARIPVAVNVSVVEPEVPILVVPEIKLPPPVTVHLEPDAAEIHHPDDADTSTPSARVPVTMNITIVEPEVIFVVHDIKPPPPVTVHLQPVLTEIHHPDSPFHRVENLFNDFESQAVALHSALCGNTCMFGFTDSRRTEAIKCAPCFCDVFCYVYDDCCPDMQLLSMVESNLPFLTEDVRAESKARDLYTCQVSHMRPEVNEVDYDNYFSMVNYCPRANGSRVNNTDPTGEGAGGPPASGSSHAGGSAVGLEGECENREGRDHWDYHRPVTSGDGLVYRNKFCAQCHGERRDNLTDWMTRVTCDADLLYNLSSASAAYSVALNTTGCDVRFLSATYLPRRDCKYVIAPVISTCNETGLWRTYDEKVERACASFTSVVDRRYKNVFCYLCNNDLSYFRAHYELNQGSFPNIIGRVSFFALLDLPGSGSDLPASSVEHEGNWTQTDVGGGQQCDKGMILDPFVCQCRPVTCAVGFRLADGNCTEVYTSTNYFGFRVTARFLMTSDLPINASVLQRLMKHVAPSQLYFNQTTGVASLGCHDDTTLAIDVNMDVYSTSPVPLPEMAQIALTTLRSLPQYIRIPRVNVTVVTPSADASRLLEWPTLIPDTCPTKNASVAMGMLALPGPKPMGVGNVMSFSPLYNTTFCPRVNLTKAEFQNFTSRLQPLGLTERNVTFDLIYESGRASYFVCVKDLREIFPQNACGALTEDTSSRKVLDVDGFEDRWTPEGMTSLICTCISLVGLLCVMVSYAALPPLREGTGLSTLAMACLLFLAQALHELGLEQFDFHGLCLALSVLIHFSWLSAVFMMTSCTLQLFYSVTFPLRARARLHSGRALRVSLLASFCLAAVIVGLTMLANHVIFGDLGYPAKHLCFIRRSLSRQLGFGLPLGLAVLFNVVLFLIAMVSIRRRPPAISTRQDRVSLTACVRLSVVTGACWLTLFLAALPGTRPWLVYVTAALLGSQGLLLATTLLLNGRVAGLWRHLQARRRKQRMDRHQGVKQTSSNGTRSTSVPHSNDTPPASYTLSPQTSNDLSGKPWVTSSSSKADAPTLYICKL